MSDLQVDSNVLEEASLEAETYSKDYWDNVFEQIGRRKFVKFALAVLALLYATAIYAPFLANDRPYVLVATDAKEYKRSLGKIRGGAYDLSRLAGTTAEAHAESQKDAEDPQSYEDAVASNLGAVTRAVEQMKASLLEEDHSALDEIKARAKSVADAAKAGGGAAAESAASELKTLAKEARKSFRAFDPEKPDKGGKVLQEQKSYPLLESVTAAEIFFAWLWLMLLTWPFWNWLVNRVLLGGDRGRIRLARKKKLYVVLGSSLIAAFLWSATVGGKAAFDSANFKDGLTSGEIVASRIVWPPLAMGYAEQAIGESFRPPTWTKKAEMDEEGYYLLGARSVRVDENTGLPNVMTPVEVKVGEPELNNAWRHPMGTDPSGRDLLSRLIYGARISLAVGILSTVLLVFFGVVIGATAGFFGGWVDLVISRIIEIFQSIPAFFLILTAVTMIPDDKIHPIFAIVFFIAVVRWTGVARLVRAEFFKLKEQEFVIAAQALGFSNTRVIFKHVLPNAMGPVLVSAAFSVAAGILTESAISFLGLGIKIPIPSWGSILNEAKGSAEYWWINLFPGLLIFLTVFCYNVVGEGVRDALDPRRKL